MPQQASYSRLTNLDLKSTEDLRLKESDPFIPDGRDPKTTAKRLLNVLHCIALVAIFCAFGIGMYKLGAAQGSLAKACFDKTIRHSPIADSINLNYHDALFDVPLFTNSVYVRQPSLEVDAAWEEITYRRKFRCSIMIAQDQTADNMSFNVIAGGMISVSLSEMLASGYSAENAHFPASQGGGFMVGIEVFHLLHCVNFLRKASFINVDYYRSQAAELAKNNFTEGSRGPFSDPIGLIRPHLNHCIEALRQTLMCRASPEIFAHKYVRNFSRILPAFVRPVKCADFESIKRESLRRQWSFHVDDAPLPEDKIWDEPNPADYLQGKVEGWSKEGWFVGGDK